MFPASHEVRVQILFDGVGEYLVRDHYLPKLVQTQDARLTTNLRLSNHVADYSQYAVDHATRNRLLDDVPIVAGIELVPAHLYVLIHHFLRLGDPGDQLRVQIGVILEIEHGRGYPDKVSNRLRRGVRLRQEKPSLYL